MGDIGAHVLRGLIEAPGEADQTAVIAKAPEIRERDAGGLEIASARDSSALNERKGAGSRRHRRVEDHCYLLPAII
jgi:hypothetical protein